MLVRETPAKLGVLLHETQTSVLGPGIVKFPAIVSRRGLNVETLELKRGPRVRECEQQRLVLVRGECEAAKVGAESRCLTGVDEELVLATTKLGT